MKTLKTTLTLLILTLLTTPAISAPPQQPPTTILTQQELLEQFLPQNSTESFLGIPWETLSKDIEGLEFETTIPVPIVPSLTLRRNTYLYSRPAVSTDIGTGHEGETSIYYTFDPYLGLSRGSFEHKLHNVDDAELESITNSIYKFLYSHLKQPSDSYKYSNIISGKEVEIQVYIWETTKNNRQMVLRFDSTSPSSHPSGIGSYEFKIYPKEITELMDAYALVQTRTEGKPFTYPDLRNIPWGSQPHEMEDLDYLDKAGNRNFYTRKTDSPVWQKIILNRTFYVFDDNHGLKSIILLIDNVPARHPASYAKRAKEILSSQFGEPAPSSPYLTQQVYNFIDGWRTPNADIVMGRIRTGFYAIIFSEPIELPETISSTPAISTKPHTPPTTILTREQLLQQFIPQNASENFLGVPWETLSKDVEGLEFEIATSVPTVPYYPVLKRNTYLYSRPTISVDIATDYENETSIYYTFDPYLGLSEGCFEHKLHNVDDAEFDSVVDSVEKFLYPHLRGPFEGSFGSRTISGKEVTTRTSTSQIIKNNRLMVLFIDAVPPSSHPSNIGVYRLHIYPQEIIELMDAYAVAQTRTQGRPFTFPDLKNIPWGIGPDEMGDFDSLKRHGDKLWCSRDTDAPIWQKIMLTNIFYIFEYGQGLTSIMLSLEYDPPPYIRRVKEILSSQFGKPAPSSSYLTERTYKVLGKWHTPNSDIVLDMISSRDSNSYFIKFYKPTEPPPSPTIYEKIKNFFTPRRPYR